MKCKKCRNLLLDNCSENVLTAHGLQMSQTNVSSDCASVKDDTLWYLNEDSLPQWISKVIEQEGWTKGKLNCPNCNSRIGSFDYTTGLKCNCTKYIIPPVHFIKSKVDYNRIPPITDAR